MMSLKRGLFSNEAGLGSAPNVAAGAGVGGIALTQTALADHVGENSLHFFSRDNRNLFNAFRVAILLLGCWGVTKDLCTMFGFADVTMLLLSLVNLITLILLFKCGLRILNHFDNQRRQGIKQPIFDASLPLDLEFDPKVWELDPVR